MTGQRTEAGTGYDRLERRVGASRGHRAVIWMRTAHRLRSKEQANGGGELSISVERPFDSEPECERTGRDIGGDGDG